MNLWIQFWGNSINIYMESVSNIIKQYWLIFQARADTIQSSHISCPKQSPEPKESNQGIGRHVIRAGRSFQFYDDWKSPCYVGFQVVSIAEANGELHNWYLQICWPHSDFIVINCMYLIFVVSCCTKIFCKGCCSLVTGSGMEYLMFSGSLDSILHSPFWLVQHRIMQESKTAIFNLNLEILFVGMQLVQLKDFYFPDTPFQSITSVMNLNLPKLKLLMKSTLSLKMVCNKLIFLSRKVTIFFNKYVFFSRLRGLCTRSFSWGCTLGPWKDVAGRIPSQSSLRCHADYLAPAHGKIEVCP